MKASRRLAPLGVALGVLAAGCASPPPARPVPRAQPTAPRVVRPEPAAPAPPRATQRPAPAAAGEARRGSAAAAAAPAPEPAASVPTPAPTPAAEPSAPAPAPPPEPSAGEQAMHQAEAAERSGQLDAALAAYRRAAQLQQPAAAARAEAVRRKLVARHIAAARGSLARQDLDGSIRHWERVLELDPGHDMARLERQRAIALREKVRALR